MERDKLKSCPFCDETVELWVKDHYCSSVWAVQCGVCGAEVTRYNRRKDAIKAWNTRAEQDTREVSEENRRLREQLRSSHHLHCNYPNRTVGECNCQPVMKVDYKRLHEQIDKLPGEDVILREITRHTIPAQYNKHIVDVAKAIYDRIKKVKC